MWAHIVGAHPGQIAGGRVGRHVGMWGEDSYMEPNIGPIQAYERPQRTTIAI